MASTIRSPPLRSAPQPIDVVVESSGRSGSVVRIPPSPFSVVDLPGLQGDFRIQCTPSLPPRPWEDTSVLAKLDAWFGESIYDSRTPGRLPLGELDAGGLKGIIWLDRSVLTSKP
jgi:hypothetical protein